MSHGTVSRCIRMRDVSELLNAARCMVQQFTRVEFKCFYFY